MLSMILDNDLRIGLGRPSQPAIVSNGALDIRFAPTINASINAPMIATITIEPNR